MAKLYWRLKVNGKWSWKPAEIAGFNSDEYYVFRLSDEELLLEEEE